MSTKEQGQGLDIAEMIKKANGSTGDNGSKDAPKKDTNLSDILQEDNNLNSKEGNSTTKVEGNETLQTLEKIINYLDKESKETNYENLFVLINLQRVIKIKSLYLDTVDKNKEFEWEQYLDTIYNSLEFIAKTNYGMGKNTKIEKLMEVVDNKIATATKDIEDSMNKVIDDLYDSLK